MGIQGRLNLAVGLSALVGLVLFTLYNFYREQELYEREVIVRKGIAVGKALSVPCLQYLVDERPEQIDDYLARFRGTELDLIYISVHDRSGRTVSHTDAWQFNSLDRDQFTRAALDAQQPFVQRFFDEQLGQLVADVALPLKKGGVRWGTMRLGLSFERAERSALGATLVGVMVSLGMVAALLIFLRWRVSQDLIDPILRLSDALMRLRGGELVKVAVKEGGELGTLLQNFNQTIAALHESQDMREKLERIEKITRSHERLEQAHVELKKAHLGLEAAHTELSRAKDQLVRSEKLVSLGQLTAGLAHEINNPVNYISNSILPLQESLQRVLEYFAQEDKAEAFDAEIAEDLQDMQTSLGLISKGIARTARIISDLRDFSYMGPAKIESFDVHEEIEKALSLLGNKLRNVKIEKKFCSVTRIEGYPGLMGQVILNLFDNAVQAMGGKGEISISTHEVPEGLALAVKDTGKGIPEEHLGRIFDPFFTSKDVGQGTGLGLAVSHTIVERHNGRIDVDSELGRGTTFTVTLPITQPREAAEQPSPA